MACREKWIVTWTHPKTLRWGRKTLRNEDKALAYIMKMVRKGMKVENEFFDCGPKK